MNRNRHTLTGPSNALIATGLFYVGLRLFELGAWLWMRVDDNLADLGGDD